MRSPLVLWPHAKFCQLGDCHHASRPLAVELGGLSSPRAR